MAADSNSIIKNLYSKFKYGLKLAGVELNRKVLADMAINDAEGFAKLAEVAKSKLA